MSFDSGPLDRYISAAVGNDPALSLDLRTAFSQSARELIDLMKRARCDANWHIAALRLKGLAATFGVIPLIQFAETAMDGIPGDPAILREIEQAIDTIS
jgi:HPt (histidine-containing phosphotransfer) domain-containing protein